jgi:hypothetical protein
MKNLNTLKNERIIVELDKTAQKNIIGGISVSLTMPAPIKKITGTYFDHEFIEE